jgi:DNA-binding transcriptional MerR regulator
VHADPLLRRALVYWRERLPMPQLDRVEIPNRALFRPPEVCEIAKVQLYVLRSWEAEFPDLGVTKTEGGTRLYRRADVERVLQLKHLVYVEGLTLSGARRRLNEGKPETDSDSLTLASVDELFGSDARERLVSVKQGLQELSAMLARPPAGARPLAVAGSSAAATADAEEFELAVTPARKTRRKKS